MRAVKGVAFIAAAIFDPSFALLCVCVCYWLIDRSIAGAHTTRRKGLGWLLTATSLSIWSIAITAGARVGISRDDARASRHLSANNSFFFLFSTLLSLSYKSLMRIERVIYRSNFMSG